MATIYLGSYVHSIELGNLEHVESGAICVSKEGVIDWVEALESREVLQTVASKYGVDLSDGSVTVVELGSDEFLCPGMIDTHTVSLHAASEGVELTPARAAVSQHWSGKRHPAP